MIEQVIIERLPMVAFYSSVLMSFLLFLHADFNTKRRRRWMVFLSAWLVSYIVIVVTVSIVDFYISWRVNTFDLDGNQMFSAREMQGDFAYWSNAEVVDTARTFVLFTGFIPAGLAVCIAYFLTLFRRGAWILIGLTRR
ncbi:hypothetical protein RHIZ_09130 [Rhizobium skierniewicense]|uniref:hypothetical protein n=1 Tax=Rhizobium TaxID=379 RepID=UPI001FADC719|nr:MULTISPECIES: hypothetical protein [Rhizobium]MCI9866103.1 hypothetical protein [Rhizobium skierniewicense]